jgi:hypothetical protein
MLRRPVAAALLVGAALTPVTLPAVTGAAPACAAATGPHAALVIETGTRDLRLCVALDAPTVSGTHLIELAGAQQHLSYGFGSGGQAICRLAGVGPQGDDCFADYPDFWGYWRGDGHGGWTWSSTGAASSTVADGDLDGWVWGSGDAGTTHARPPSLTETDVCVASTSSPTPAASPQTHSASPDASRSAAGASSSSARPPHASRTAEPSASTDRTTLASTKAPSSILVAAADRGPPPASGGPGAGLLLALAIGAALAAGGWLRSRSGRGRDEVAAP